jgi:hypothetical protein
MDQRFGTGLDSAASRLPIERLIRAFIRLYELKSTDSLEFRAGSEILGAV